jgi:hypothetical protein
VTDPTPAEIASDLRPLTHAECKARNLIHSSGDCSWDEFDDSGSDDDCRQALRSARRRCGL